MSSFELPPSLPAALGTYLYGLEDPGTGELFYVGRGVGERCRHHAKAALIDGKPSDKLERIRTIQELQKTDPRIVILRHGLPSIASPQQVAAEVEAAVIDVLLRWKVPLTNVVRGAHTVRGLRTLHSLCAELAPNPLALKRPAMLVNITRTWFDGMSDEEMWEAARCWWKAQPQLHEPRPELLLACADQIVRAAWELPWDEGAASVCEQRQIEWNDLDRQRQAIYGNQSAFSAGKRCRFMARKTPADLDQLAGRHVGSVGRSYGSAFRYGP